MTGAACAAFVGAVLAAGAATTAADQGEAPLSWVRLEPSAGLGTPWRVQQGQSPQRLPRTGRFSLLLTDDTGELRQHYRVIGAVAGRRVDAVETLDNSDADAIRYRGYIDRSQPAVLCWHLFHAKTALLICEGPAALLAPQR